MKNNLTLIQKIFFAIIVSVCLAYGCAGVKTEQESEQLPLSPVEAKVEQPKKEEVPSTPATSDISAKSSPPPAPPTVSESRKGIPPTHPLAPLVPPLRSTKITWNSVNLREGPGMNYKVIGHAKKGTPLGVLQDKGKWLQIRLQDGSEAWVIKAATSEAPKPSPAMAPKPKPM